MRGDWFTTGDRYERRDGRRLRLRRAAIDDMLKVGGLWVSPIDMEHVLLEHPRVLGVGVVGVTRRRREPDRGLRRVRRTTADPPDDALAEELRTWCKERLRRYEFPHVVDFVDELPRTPTGKVQRFKLRKMAAEGSER